MFIVLIISIGRHCFNDHRTTGIYNVTLHTIAVLIMSFVCLYTKLLLSIRIMHTNGENKNK